MKQWKEVVLKAKLFFERQGFIVNDVDACTRQNNLFGLFDFVMIRKKEVVFVKIAVDEPYDHLKYLKFRKEFDIDVYQLLLHSKTKTWTTMIYKGSENDERTYRKGSPRLD